MKKFTILVDGNNYHNNQSELFEYLTSLNGVEDVVITADDLLNIIILYNEKLINDERLRFEILAFLKLLNYPSIYGFDKHHTASKRIKLKCRVCCDFCFGNIIYPLIETEGIDKVESDFYQIWQKSGDDNYFINIYYNPKVISQKKLDQLLKKIYVYE